MVSFSFAGPLTNFNFVFIMINMKKRRTYTMRARAESAATTRQRILAETTTLLSQRLRADIRLEDVAEAAGVSVQTVLRVFGSRAALLDRAFQEVARQISEQRDRAEPGDVVGAIAGLFDHYERVGDIVIRNLAEEDDPAVKLPLQIGRARHRQWVEAHFRPQLDQRDPALREKLVDALVCACDVYIWKLLRRDMGRPRAEAEATMALMVRSLLGESAS